MGVNIIGPHGPSVGETTVRPTDTSSGNANDTWFQDCVGGVAGTGTKVPARWLNKVTAQLRRAIRGRGVTENELDDDMLLKAINSADKAVDNLGSTGAGIVGLVVGLNEDGDTYMVRRLKQGAGVTLSVDFDGYAVIAATGATPTLATIAPMMIVHQTRAGNGTPAALTNTTWVDRILNTLVVNQISGAEHDGSTGIVTLPAGVYRVEFAAMAFASGNHKARLFNVTANAAIIDGTTADSYDFADSSQNCNSSVGIHRFTLATPSGIKLQHFKGAAGNGKQGDTSNISPESHLDAWLAITKES